MTRPFHWRRDAARELLRLLDAADRLETQNCGNPRPCDGIRVDWAAIRRAKRGRSIQTREKRGNRNPPDSGPAVVNSRTTARLISENGRKLK